jgi:hypothetical protein
MPYKVLIAIKNEWWSDQKALPTFAAAQRHRVVLAQRWNDCDTAIQAPDGRVLAFRESLQEQAELKKILAEA